MQPDDKINFLAQMCFTLAGAVKTCADELVPPDAALAAAMTALKAEILSEFPFVT